MNTITLNGVSSENIQGLMIQSLPPISKPPIRVNVEEIDGRNGDIITDLGYQAYDKTITIGLRGSFDINQVISFFNSEGTVVFSNEPDKYYRYKIYQQIDFERLIRYRVANVTMHVQPFKYPLNESPISVSSLKWEGTDYDQTPYIFRAVSDSSVEVGNREVIEQIAGGTVAWNQLVGISERSTETVIGITVTNNGDGSYSLSGTATGTPLNYWLLGGWNRTTELFSVYKNHKYYMQDCIFFSVTSRPMSKEVTLDAPKSIVQATDNFAITGARLPNATTDTLYNKTIYPMAIDLTQLFGPAIADYIYQQEQSQAGKGVSLFKSLFPKNFYAHNTGTLMSVKTSAHETDGDYAPYEHHTYPLSNIELRGVPKLVSNKIQYDGDIYKADGSVTRRYGIVNLSTFTWNASTAQDGLYYAWLNSIQSGPGKVHASAINGRYANTDEIYTAIADKSFSTNNGNFTSLSVMFIRDTTFADAASLKASLSGVYLVYELATPTTETTTPYTETQICSPYGTEEFIDTRDVQIPVGHKTKYEQIDPINIEITNSGNVPSMPTYRIEGSGSIDVNIDGLHAVTVDMSNINAITINSEEMNAYNDTGGFANRSVTGSYENLSLPSGDNTLEIDGDGVIDLLVTNYERWL